MTYFRAIRTIMGPECLTAVFGMGTGVATWVWSPEISNGRRNRVAIFARTGPGKYEAALLRRDQFDGDRPWQIVDPKSKIPSLGGQDQCGQALGC